MKLLSWNVNGIRAVLKKLDLHQIVQDLDLDTLCLQEVKAEAEQVDFDIPGYQKFWHHSIVKKGYSGTAVFTRLPVISYRYGIGIAEHDQEGRVITLEHADYFLVNVYTPNSKDGLLRIDYRVEWEKAFLSYLKNLEKSKPVVLCGDLNVAHQEIDLANPDQNHNSPGFSPQERLAFNNLLNSGFTDTFRYCYPQEVKYSWWSYRSFARERNVGWRIDYFIVSNSLTDRIIDAKIFNEIEGSDHCPVFLNLK